MFSARKARQVPPLTEEPPRHTSLLWKPAKPIGLLCSPKHRRMKQPVNDRYGRIEKTETIRDRDTERGGRETERMSKGEEKGERRRENTLGNDLFFIPYCYKTLKWRIKVDRTRVTQTRASGIWRQLEEFWTLAAGQKPERSVYLSFVLWRNVKDHATKRSVLSSHWVLGNTCPKTCAHTHTHAPTHTHTPDAHTHTRRTHTPDTHTQTRKPLLWFYALFLILND